MVATILDGAASIAANTYGDARRLALRLRDERHDDAQLARDVALALVGIAEEAHRAAELAAQIGGVVWP